MSDQPNKPEEERSIEIEVNPGDSYSFREGWTQRARNPRLEAIEEQLRQHEERLARIEAALIDRHLG